MTTAANKAYAVEIADKGEEFEITIGSVVKTVKFSDVNQKYINREFLRGLKLRIDNAAAGSEDEKKLSAKTEMLSKIDFSHPSGGISGGRKKESSDGFLARYTDEESNSKITNLEEYQAAIADAQANVRKDELSDVLVELSTTLADIISA